MLKVSRFHVGTKFGSDAQKPPTRCSQEASKTPQDGPKTRPRSRRTAPRRFLRFIGPQPPGTRTPTGSPCACRRPKTAHCAPKTSQRGPERPWDGPKTLPIHPKTALKTAYCAPRTPQETPTLLRHPKTLPRRPGRTQTVPEAPAPRRVSRCHRLKCLQKSDSKSTRKSVKVLRTTNKLDK